MNGLQIMTMEMIGGRSRRMERCKRNDNNDNNDTSFPSGSTSHHEVYQSL